MAYVTDAQLRHHIGIEDSDDDARLLIARAAAEQRVTLHCGRSFEVSGTPATARVFTADGPGVCRIDDATQIDLVETGSAATSWVSMPATAWVAEPANGVRDGLSGWPQYLLSPSAGWRFPCGSQQVRVTAEWGWAATPDNVILATLILAHRLWRRKDSPEGVLGFDGEGVVVTMRRTDPDVAELLEPFCRVAR